MRFLQTRSIMSMSEKEVKIRLLYAYQIFASMNESQIDSDIVKLVISFVRRLNKMMRFTFVLDKYVMKLWAENYLHFVPEEEEDNVWSFSSRRKNKYHFYEDTDADTRFSFLRIHDEVVANFIRCLYVDSKEFILRIIEHTFLRIHKRLT